MVCECTKLAPGRLIYIHMYIYPMCMFMCVPLIQTGKPVLAVLVPFRSSLEVVLVMQTARDGRASWELPADIFPFVTSAPQVNDFGVLICTPLALFFGR